MKSLIEMIADHPTLSDIAKQRLIALALVLESIREELERIEANADRSTHTTL